MTKCVCLRYIDFLWHLVNKWESLTIVCCTADRRAWVTRSTAGQLEQIQTMPLYRPISWDISDNRIVFGELVLNVLKNIKEVRMLTYLNLSNAFTSRLKKGLFSDRNPIWSFCISEFRTLWCNGTIGTPGCSRTGNLYMTFALQRTDGEWI